jgi:uncharacterized membrane protein
MSADLILLKFDDTYDAQSALGAVRALEEMRYLWLEDVAVVERHHSGRISTHTTHGSVTEGTAWGSLTGGLVGLLFGPVGFIAGILFGGGAGALIGRATKTTGMDADLLNEIKAALDKGTSALVLIGAEGDADQMTRAFEPYSPTQVIRRTLEESTLETIKTNLEHGDDAGGATAEPGD